MNKYHPRYLTLLNKMGNVTPKKARTILSSQHEGFSQEEVPLIVNNIHPTQTIKLLIDNLHIIVDVVFSLYAIQSQHKGCKLLWVNDGAGHKGKSPRMMKNQLDRMHHRGLTLIEGLWLIAAYPHILKNHAIDLLETKYSIECVPTLYLWKNRIHLSAICPDAQDALCAAPHIYREIQLTP